MPRPSYLLLLGLLSGVVGVALGCYGDNPALAQAPATAFLATFLASGPAAPWITGAATSLLIFLVLGFFLPAIADGWALAALSERLQKLVPGVAPEAFRAAFGSSPLIRAGRLYYANLWQARATDAAADAPPPPWRSTLDAATVFRPAGEMREAAGSLFTQVSLVLTAVGIAAYVLLGHDAAAPAPPVALAIGGLGLAALLGVRLLSYIRGELVADVAHLCQALYRPSGSEYLVERMAALIDTDSTASREAIIQGFAASMSELKSTLASHDRRIAHAVGNAVQRVVQPITTSVQDMLTSLEAADATQAAELLQTVLGEFLASFHERFGGAMTELGEILSATKLLAEELRRSLAASEATLTSGTVELSRTVLETVRDAVEEAVAQQTDAMRTIVQNVDDTVLQTGAGLERLAARTDAAMTLWSERTEAMARAVVAGSAGELKETAAAFNRVHSILETLSVSVLPAINKLVTTQERLQSTVASSGQSAHAVSTAAGDLAEAAKIARDMVDRQILFTRELAQLSHGGGAARPAPAPAPAPDLGSDLARAIGDLRAEADDDRKSLPSL